MSAMHLRPMRGTGAGTGRPGLDVPPNFYRYRGGQPLAAELPQAVSGGRPSAVRAQAGARRERFNALRGQGLGVTEAGAAVGVVPDTARKYEQRRRQEARGGGGEASRG